MVYVLGPIEGPSAALHRNLSVPAAGPTCGAVLSVPSQDWLYGACNVPEASALRAPHGLGLVLPHRYPDVSQKHRAWEGAAGEGDPYRRAFSEAADGADLGSGAAELQA